MASREDTVTVSVVTERAPVIIECPTRSFTAEELCIILCKKYNIPPLTRTLFALRIKGSRYFLKDNSEVLSGSRDYELRIRFKVSIYHTVYSSSQFDPQTWLLLCMHVIIYSVHVTFDGLCNCVSISTKAHSSNTPCTFYSLLILS